MYRLKGGGIFPFRIQIDRRRKPHRSHNRCSKIGKNVAEKIRSHHHIEPVGMSDEMRGQNVDVVLVGLYVRILFEIAAKRSSQNGME